jgi:hypothetical protein
MPSPSRNDRQINEVIEREHRRLLRKLPDDLSAFLDACQRVAEPRRTVLASRWFWVGASGVGLRPIRTPAEYRIHQFGAAEAALARFKRLGPQHDGADALFFPKSAYPMYRVPLGWVRKNVARLYAASPGGLGVVREDFTAGAVLARFVGNLPHAPNPSKLHYDLGLWGFVRPIRRERSGGADLCKSPSGAARTKLKGRAR